VKVWACAACTATVIIDRTNMSAVIAARDGTLKWKLHL
jgi:hypothetical protein